MTSVGVALFILHVLDRATAGWTRRSWLAAAIVVALIAGLVAARTGEAGAAAVEGLVAGLLAATVVYSVLRFDARAVPGYVVTAALISALENALLTATAAGWAGFAVTALVSIAVGAAATRYIGAPLVPSSTT
mgnify:CR=1 FL=1